jgi:hypothetical protein
LHDDIATQISSHLPSHFLQLKQQQQTGLSIFTTLKVFQTERLEFFLQESKGMGYVYVWYMYKKFIKSTVEYLRAF